MERNGLVLIVLVFGDENDKLKFDYIYNKYKKLMLYKAYGVLKDYSLAEDATSEAFIRVYRNLHKIEDVDSNQTICFLVTIQKNIAITLLNKKIKENTVEIEEFDSEDDFNLEDFVITEKNTESILNVISKLKEDLKAPFLLKYVNDLSHKEISKVLNISESNVTVRIHRAKKKIVKLLEKEGLACER